jgi:hypothetical protein
MKKEFYVKDEVYIELKPGLYALVMIVEKHIVYGRWLYEVVCPNGIGSAKFQGESLIEKKEIKKIDGKQFGILPKNED